MKINEFTNPLKSYMATIRVVINNNTSTCRTRIDAENSNQALLLLTRMYGVGNVINLTQLMSEDHEVTEATKTLNPQELQVKSMSDKAKQLNQQAKQLKARQSLAKAQEKMRMAVAQS
jgi:hypothetical protein